MEFNDIIKAIGIEPYYRDWQSDIVIYNADCRDILPLIPDKSIDLVLTSPPYNLGNSHHTGGYKHQAYEDDMPELDYQNWQIDILSNLYKVVKDSGSCWYQHKNRIKQGVSITPYQWLLKTEWLLKQEIVWVNRSQNFDKCRFYPMTERLYWMVKDSVTILNNIINRHDDWHIEPVGTNGEHTRAFPEELASNVLACFDSDIVFDPFLGSGTTAVACKKLGRKCIGIEIEKKYCDIAVKRLAQGVLL